MTSCSVGLFGVTFRHTVYVSGLRRGLFYMKTAIHKVYFSMKHSDPSAMKTALTLLLFLSLVCHSHTLKCHTCVASNEEDCNRQGSTSCPQYADACSTITGPNTVMKSCTYKGFCDKAHGGSSGAKMECCFGDDCNGPHRSHSHGNHGNGAGALASSPVLLITALLVRTAFNQL
ncbi:uncharacterized protein V6R79_005712 [Siganus canaliculatus]